MTIYDAAMRYRQEGVPLLVIAGKEYGIGSSRDWAAKGSALLGVRAVIAESYERIHRSNLIGMGVLPLEFLPGEGRASLGLTGDETYDIEGLSRRSEAAEAGKGARPGRRRHEKTFEAVVRIDSPLEVEQYRHGGILPMIVRRLVSSG